MATLAESFLADLEDLSDNENVQEHEEDEQQEAEGEDLDMEDIPAIDYNDLHNVAKLSGEQHYKDVMQRVRDVLDGTTQEAEVRAGHLEDDPTYKLLVECNKLAVDIDNEVLNVYNFVRDKYKLKFPELESLVHHPVDFVKVVQRIGNEMDLTLVDLEDILPAASVMVVTVSATTTSGTQLSEEQLARVLEGCEMLLGLDADKRRIVEFVELHMHKIAPNLSAVIGSETAARLMGLAGGLAILSRMPACNIQVLGSKRKNLAGFSTSSVQPHQGFIFNSTIIQSTPPGLRTKAVRLLAGKAALLARVDAYGQDPSGEVGQKMLVEVQGKIDKWQEPPPAKQIKPLPKPDAEVKKRRGGRRLRKLKERYGMTDMRKAANRMMFNQAEDELIDGEDTIGLGTIGKEGSGRLRVVASQQRMKLNAKAMKKNKAKYYGSGTATNGLSSSLAFTPVQGIELSNPSVAFGQEAVDTKSGTESYFSEYSGFRSIVARGQPQPKG